MSCSATLSAVPESKVSVVGPEIRLTAKSALSLALAVNELATNAAKYGALSTPDGHVEISWTLGGTTPSEKAQLVWTWQEFGGPVVASPTRRGFGTFLIERVLAADFGGSVRIQYPPPGVVCELRAPVPHNSKT